MNTLSALTVILVYLSGCSPYKSGFNCPVPEGMPCTSMSRIDDLINQGRLPKKESLDDKDTCTSCSKQPKLAHQKSEWVEVVVLNHESTERMGKSNIGESQTGLPRRYVVEVPDDRGGHVNA